MKVIAIVGGMKPNAKRIVEENEKYREQYLNQSAFNKAIKRLWLGNDDLETAIQIISALSDVIQKQQDMLIDKEIDRKT